MYFIGRIGKRFHTPLRDFIIRIRIKIFTYTYINSSISIPFFYFYYIILSMRIWWKN